MNFSFCLILMECMIQELLKFLFFQFSLRKPIDSHWFKKVLFELFRSIEMYFYGYFQTVLISWPRPILLQYTVRICCYKSENICVIMLNLWSYVDIYQRIKLTLSFVSRSRMGLETSPSPFSKMHNFPDIWINLNSWDISPKNILSCLELELFQSISNQAAYSVDHLMQIIKTSWRAWDYFLGLWNHDATHFWINMSLNHGKIYSNAQNFILQPQLSFE